METNNLQNGSEAFRTFPNSSESISESVQKENHTLSVREVVKLFEAKGVDITERSIVNYCHPNKYGVSLLDSYFDQNERKHFISPESVEKAIVEVRARKIKTNDISASVPNSSESPSETFGNIPNDSETDKKEISEEEVRKIKELEQEIIDLKITNKGKDYFINQMKDQNNKLMEAMRNDRTLIGELKTKVHQLEAPKNSPKSDENNNSYSFVEAEEKKPVEGQNEEN